MATLSAISSWNLLKALGTNQQQVTNYPVSRTATKQAIICLLALSAGLARSAYAHSPICDCYDNGDNSITCEGGFSDGGTAIGVPIRVFDDDGKVLIEGAMSEHSDFTFTKPGGYFHVEFDGGAGHIVQIDGRDIEE